MKFFKIPKLHLNSRECQEMFLDNVKFSKKTQQFYFQNYPDVNVEIFKKVVEDRFYSTLFGGVGSRRLYRELCELALNSKPLFCRFQERFEEALVFKGDF